MLWGRTIRNAGEFFANINSNAKFFSGQLPFACWSKCLYVISYGKIREQLAYDSTFQDK